MTYTLLLLFFILEYVRPTSYIPGLLALHLNSIVPLSAFAGSLIFSGQQAIPRLIAEANTKAFVFLYGLVWLSVFTADVQQLAFDAQNVMLGFVLIYWVIGSELTSVLRIKGVIMIMILVHLMVTALNPLLLTDPSNRHYISSGSFLGDGNDFALSLVCVIPLCLFLLQDATRTALKMLWGLALLVLVASVVATQSRGGTLGLGAMALYYWAKSDRKFQTGAICGMAVVLILALAPGSYFGRISSIGDMQEGSAQGRITAWKAASRMAFDNPLLGVGAAHFGMKIGTEYRPPDMVGSGMTAHSVYFLALGELGLPGLAIVIFIIVSNVRANRRTELEVRQRATANQARDLHLLAATSASLIAFATAGAFLSALYYPHLYVLAGIMAGTRSVVLASRAAAPARATTVAPAAPGMEVHWALRPTPRTLQTPRLGPRR